MAYTHGLISPTCSIGTESSWLAMYSVPHCLLFAAAAVQVGMAWEEKPVARERIWGLTATLPTTTGWIHVRIGRYSSRPPL
jgi:hypothetical protein